MGKILGGSEIDEALDITSTADGNFIVCNTRSNNIDVSLNNGAADVWLLKITPNEKYYGKRHTAEIALIQQSHP